MMEPKRITVRPTFLIATFSVLLVSLSQSSSAHGSLQWEQTLEAHDRLVLCAFRIGMPKSLNRL